MPSATAIGGRREILHSGRREKRNSSFSQQLNDKLQKNSSSVIQIYNGGTFIYKKKKELYSRIIFKFRGSIIMCGNHTVIVTCLIAAAVIFGGIVAIIVVFKMPENQEVGIKTDSIQETFTERSEVDQIISFEEEEKFKGVIEKIFYNATNEFRIHGNVTHKIHLANLNHDKKLHQVSQSHETIRTSVIIGTIFCIVAAVGLTVVGTCFMLSKRRQPRTENRLVTYQVDHRPDTTMGGFIGFQDGGGRNILARSQGSLASLFPPVTLD